MIHRPVSSLDRFIGRYAPALAGVDDGMRVLRRLLTVLEYGAVGFVAILGPTAVTVGLIGLASLFIAAGLGPFAAYVDPLDYVFACAPCLLLGVSLFGARALLDCRLALSNRSRRLTPEARTLVRALTAHLQGRLTRQGRRRYQRAVRQGLLRPLHDRRSEDLLEPQAFEVLEAAAREYNRIRGALTPTNGSFVIALRDRRRRIRAVADETMAKVLHATAALNRFPEGSAQAVSLASERVEELRALVRQVQRLQVTAASHAIGPGGPSRIRRLLEDPRRSAIDGDDQG